MGRGLTDHPDAPEKRSRDEQVRASIFVACGSGYARKTVVQLLPTSESA